MVIQLLKFLQTSKALEVHISRRWGLQPLKVDKMSDELKPRAGVAIGESVSCSETSIDTLSLFVTSLAAMFIFCIPVALVLPTINPALY